MAVTYYERFADDALIKQAKETSRIRMVSSPPGPYLGATICELECRPGDTQVAGSNAGIRSEVYISSTAAGAFNGVDQWWAFTLVSPSGPIPTGGWGMRHQWHGPNGTGQPQAILNSLNGDLNLRLWDAGTNQQWNHPVRDASGNVIRYANGAVYHFVQHIVHSTNPGVGRVEMWCNGVKFCDRKFQTVFTHRADGSSLGSDLRNYPKFGIYTNNTSGTYLQRVDGIRRGASFAEVVADFPASAGYGTSGGGGTTPDTTPPSVIITAPLQGATISGVTPFTVDATDAGGIDRVEFFVDGVLVLTERSAPYGDTPGFLDTSTLADGTRTLKATAYDLAGNSASDSLTVQVANSATLTSSPWAGPFAVQVVAPTAAPWAGPFSVLISDAPAPGPWAGPFTVQVGPDASPWAGPFTVEVAPDVTPGEVVEPGTLSPVGAELYAALEPLHYGDAAAGYPLRSLCEAAGLGLDPIDALVRDTDEGPGWSALVDVERAPAFALDWLAQLVGVRLTAGAGEATRRREVREAAGWRRGSLRALIAAVRATLTGAKTALVRERDGSPYRLTVISYASQTPDPAATEAAARAQKAAGLVLTYLLQTGLDYTSHEALHATYADAEAAYATYADAEAAS